MTVEIRKTQFSSRIVRKGAGVTRHQEVLGCRDHRRPLALRTRRYVRDTVADLPRAQRG